MAKPLLNIHCIEESSCEYPVAVRIAMDDGTVQTYALENKTEIQFSKIMNCLHRIQANIEDLRVGYQYDPKKRSRIPLSERRARREHWK